MQLLTTVPTFSELEALIPELKAVLFDLDGTIFNSEPLHSKAFQKFLSENALSLPPDEADNLFRGMCDSQVYEYLINNNKCKFDEIYFVERKTEIFLKLLNNDNCGIATGIVALIKEIKKKNLPCAVVTSSEKSIAHKFLEITNLKDNFQFVLTREDTARNKPDPMPYQTAMEKLQVTPESTVIFEDSVPGLKSAKESGANVIKVGWF